jgi:hypothetical protein
VVSLHLALTPCLPAVTPSKTTKRPFEVDSGPGRQVRGVVLGGYTRIDWPASARTTVIRHNFVAECIVAKADWCSLTRIDLAWM